MGGLDKQIIIDGVDVKDCKRRIGKNNYCRYYKRPCAENNYNCIWKKYLRKEQECEELRGVIRKDICSHYVLGECSQKHHNNCVGRNQCIQDLEQKLEKIKQYLCENVCLEGENCKFCDNHDCINIEILKIIEE